MAIYMNVIKVLSLAFYAPQVFCCFFALLVNNLILSEIIQCSYRVLCYSLYYLTLT